MSRPNQLASATTHFLSRSALARQMNHQQHDMYTMGQALDDPEMMDSLAWIDDMEIEEAYVVQLGQALFEPPHDYVAEFSSTISDAHFDDTDKTRGLTREQKAELAHYDSERQWPVLSFANAPGRGGSLNTAHLIAMTVEGLDYFVNHRHGGDVKAAKIEWTRKVSSGRQTRKRAREMILP